MGEIRVNGNTVAIFENGTVYAGGSTWGDILGYYGGGKIEDRYHKTVAKYSAGTAYDLDTVSFGTAGWTPGSALCHCTMSTIYEGGNSWNNSLGSFVGDVDGACAAATLYFFQHNEMTVTEHTHVENPVDEIGVPGMDWTSFWGVLIGAAFCLLTIYMFWFTNEGREMLFGEPEGLFTVGVCILSAIIGSYKIFRKYATFQDDAGMHRLVY